MFVRILSMVAVSIVLLATPVISHAKVLSKKIFSSKPDSPTACINWSKVFERESVRQIENRNYLIGVAPFRDDTGVTGDDWLSQGVANLLIHLLNTNSNVGAMSESNALYLPPEHPVGFKIGGLFQHTQNWLRIFVQLKDSKDKLIAQFTVETPYPLHKQFFTGLREAGAGIFDKIGLKKKINMDALKAIENETGNIRAYENYTRGLQALTSYDPNKMEVAIIWFQEARREDNQYPMAYRGLMDVYNFLSLSHKANGAPYGQDLENAESTLKALAKQGRNTGSEGKSKFKKEEEGIDNRFLSAQVHFVLGSRLLTKGDAGKAVAELSQAAQLVPEDPVTALALSQAYEKSGQATLAGQFKNHAEEINACLKGQ